MSVIIDTANRVRTTQSIRADEVDLGDTLVLNHGMAGQRLVTVGLIDRTQAGHIYLGYEETALQTSHDLIRYPHVTLAV